MYAIIRDRGKQYKVSEGDVLELDLLDGKQAGETLELSEVLLTSDEQGGVQVGQPLVAEASVSATVVSPNYKGLKIDVVHFRRRKDSMSKVGHRQRYTQIKIDKIKVAG